MSTLPTRPLGRGGPLVTRLGLGLAALGRPGYINLGHADDLGHGRDVATMTATAHTVLDAAYDAGVRYFDAARSYGRAEAFLAGWLAARGLSPGEVVVGSKWGYTYTAGWQVDAERHEIKDHSRANLDRQAAESRALLGPFLGLYQIHSATLETGVLDDPAVHAGLAALKAEGLRVGLSVSGPGQADAIRRALAVTVDGQPLFDAVQATWNLLERSAGPAMAEAHAAGLGVIVKEGLANGRLTPRNADPGFADQARALAREADRLGTTVDALALAAVLAQPWADVVLSGAATVEHLHANLAAAGVAFDATAAAALAPLAEPPGSYWATRARLPWN